MMSVSWARWIQSRAARRSPTGWGADTRRNQRGLPAGSTGAKHGAEWTRTLGRSRCASRTLDVVNQGALPDMVLKFIGLPVGYCSGVTERQVDLPAQDQLLGPCLGIGAACGPLGSGEAVALQLRLQGVVALLR
jgi:hypothetical protein